MNKNLQELLMLGEGQSVEFKTSRKPMIIGRQVCAFLNSGGGYVICGIGDAGEILGINDIDTKQLERQLHEGISPAALISVDIQEVEEKRVLIVEVPAGKDFPYAFHNEIFIREGGLTVKADIETIRDLVMRRQMEPERWERRFSSVDLETELDLDEIQSLARIVNKNSRTQFRDKHDPHVILKDLALLKYGRLTNGGDVLFGKTPAIRHPQVRVRAVCFSSDKADDRYQDMKSIEGPLASALEQVFSFIMRNTPTPSHFNKNSLERQDEAVYPPEAVREGLVNAFAHRDYADFSGGIAVHIYPKRLEIWNSGTLPEGVTLDKLATGHISVLRNPDIAHVLYLRGMMEKLGRGSVMIQQSCLDRGLPRPKWHSEGGHGVTLTFFASEDIDGLGTQSALSRHPVENKFTPNDIQLKILDNCKTPKAISELLQIARRSDRTKFRHQVLRPLLEANLIEMTIPDKPTSSKQRYWITPLGNQYLA